MKLIIEVNTQNIEEMVEAVALLNMYTVKLDKGAVFQAETVVEALKEEKATPSIPEEVKEPEQAEKPKRKRRSKAEIEADKAKSEPVVTEPEPSQITLGELKDLAQTKARDIDRAKVKAIIAKFAPKLTEVSEEDYSKLAELLNELV